MIWLWVGGTGRCGTSLLRDTLALHPKVYAIPHETNPDPSDNNRWSNWLRSYGRMHLIAAQNQGATYVVEKTPRNALLAEGLRERIVRLPEVSHADYIHMTRDPVDATMAIRRFGRYPMAGMGPLPESDDAVRLWVEWVNWTAQEHAAHTVTLEGLLKTPRTALELGNLQATDEQVRYVEASRRG